MRRWPSAGAISPTRTEVTVPAAFDGTLASLYRDERQRVFATPVRLLGSVDVAEEARPDGLFAAAEAAATTYAPTTRRVFRAAAGCSRKRRCTARTRPRRT